MNIARFHANVLFSVETFQMYHDQSLEDVASGVWLNNS